MAQQYLKSNQLITYGSELLKCGTGCVRNRLGSTDQAIKRQMYPSDCWNSGEGVRLRISCSRLTQTMSAWGNCRSQVHAIYSRM